MAIYKNTNSDWYITVNNGTGTIYLDGSLDVTGNITYVSEIAVNDAFIIVAANNTGTVQDMGLLAQTGNTSFAGLRFDTVANTWQISSSVYANGVPVASYSNILTGGGSAFVAGSDTEIQFNQGGSFGASSSLTFDYGNNKLTVSGYEVFGNIGANPGYAGNGVALYNSTTGAGSTGLFVVGATTNNDELISLTRARLYSIIF
jgi:hypothetical protein